MRRIHIAFIFALFFIMLLPGNLAKAVDVNSYSSLKKELEKSGSATVNVTEKILIKGVIHVRGTKTLNGMNNNLNRDATTGKQYYGVLFQVGKAGAYTGHLTVKNAVISGNGQEASMSAGADGRLIRVVEPGSSLVLTDGAVLKNNFNSDRIMDGGGGVTVLNGCTAEMRGSSQIISNRSKTGGAAIRVEAGGSFTLTNGLIQGNQVNQYQLDDIYGGLGGAIHNFGYVEIKKGEILGNVANGDGVNGGLGGGIYNQGELVIASGTIQGNLASLGGGAIYSSGSRSLTQIKEGSIVQNACGDCGGGLFINNGGRLLFEGGEIGGNQAGTGGGVYLSKQETRMEMKGGWIHGNVASKSTNLTGGGLRVNGATAEISGGVFGINRQNRKSDNLCPNTGKPNYSSLIYNSGIVRATGGNLYSSAVGARAIVNMGEMELKFKRNCGIHGEGEVAVLNYATLMYGSISGSAPLIDGSFKIGVENNQQMVMRQGNISASIDGIKNHGDLEIYGGASHGRRGVNALAGSLVLGGKVTIPSIYLASGQIVHVAGGVDINGGLLCPDDYYEGRVLVRSDIEDADFNMKQFRLEPKNPYRMQSAGKKLYITVIRYIVEFDSNGGKGYTDSIVSIAGMPITMPKCGFTRNGCVFLGWSKVRFSKPVLSEKPDYKEQEIVPSLADEKTVITLYAVWGSVPTFKPVYSDVEFYQGEYVDEKILKSLVTVYDELDGDISQSVRIEKIIYRGAIAYYSIHLDTAAKYIGTIQIHYKCKNQSGRNTDYYLSVRLKENQPPSIKGKDRYYFLDELKEMTIDEVVDELTTTVEFRDDVESKDELMKDYYINKIDIPIDRTGNHTVYINVRDQYGHRFYMKPNEKKRYGSGKTSDCLFLFHIIANTQNHDEFAGYVRFISSAHIDTLSQSSKWRGTQLSQRIKTYFERETVGGNCASIWCFDKTQIDAVQALNESGEDLFGEEANLNFLQRFHPIIRKEDEE